MSTQETPSLVPVHADGRKATWFELFFDLVFVVAVAQFAAAYARQFDLAGAAQFSLAFLALWWCWLGHTFHASRFDQDRSSQRLVGFVQASAVCLVAYGASDPLATRAWAFAGGIAAFKLLLALAYGREWRWPGARPLIRRYVAIYVAQSALWLLGLGLGPAGSLALWGAALLLDMVSPLIVARQTHAVPPHHEHLPERFGLFTIILLGEGMASVVHALDHGDHWSTASALIASGSALTTFMLWVGYFDRVKGQSERHVADARAGTRLRLWAYGHIPLYLGIASLSAGTVALAHVEALARTQALLYTAGVALSMAGITILGMAQRDDGLRRALPHLAAAAATLLLGLVLAGLPPAVPAFVCAAACAGQVALARARKARA